MPGPWKPYNQNHVGRTTQALYGFLTDLFDGTKGPALRKQLLGAMSEDEVRAVLVTYGIVIPRQTDQGDPLRIMLVDVQNAQTWQEPPPINPVTDYFYLLVMPPVPSNPNYPGQPGYQDMQAWESAWYHAIVDGYGM